VKIDLITIFPGFFLSPLETSILGRAIDKGKAQVQIHDLRNFAVDRHRTVDDTPYGGGGGMVLKPEPVALAWETLKLSQGHCVYLSADGMPFTQQLAIELSLIPHLVLLCGHYKGIDERIRTRFIDREISVGDYILTGGEPAALILIDAIARLIPGVLGNFSSALEDSFEDGLLDCPWYTRPAAFEGETVPEILLSGNHSAVDKWRRLQALRRTFERRPELLDAADLAPEERALLDQWSKN
jgi:tRNA (guanine37-N1)-methyltransferase